LTDTLTKYYAPVTFSNSNTISLYTDALHCKPGEKRGTLYQQTN